MALMKEDISWMWQQLCHCSALPNPDENFGAWEVLIQEHYEYWKKLVNRAVGHDRLQKKTIV